MSTLNQKLDYFPARLQEGKFAWYIIFYQELPNARPTDKKKRFRKTFGINRIPDLEERRDYAKRKIKRINRILKKGIPYVGQKEAQPKKKDLRDTNVLNALVLIPKVLTP